jgi:hypothetical protein
MSTTSGDLFFEERRIHGIDGSCRSASANTASRRAICAAGTARNAVANRVVVGVDAQLLA